MIACTVINSVTYFFDYFKAYLTKNESHFKRIFNFVQGIDRTRPDKTAAKTLQGTSQCKRVSRGLLEVRNYTCTCLTCLNPGHGSCVNDANIESWGICDIVVQKKKDQKMTKADEKKKPKDKEKMKRSSTKKKRDVVNKLKNKQNWTDQEKIGDEDRGSSDQEKVTGRKRQKRDKLEELTDKGKLSDQKKKGDEVRKSTEQEKASDLKKKKAKRRSSGVHREGRHCYELN